MVQYRRHYIGFKKGEIMVLGLKNDYLTVQFSDFGAQLTSIKDADGIEYLWHHDPNFWTGQALVLFQFTKVLEMIGQFINLQSVPILLDYSKAELQFLKFYSFNFCSSILFSVNFFTPSFFQGNNSCF